MAILFFSNPPSSTSESFARALILIELSSFKEILSFVATGASLTAFIVIFRVLVMPAPLESEMV